MACSKYILTNTGSTLVNFSYQRCDDTLWDYQVELLPNQTKNIWVINGTYTVAPAFKNVINFVNEGSFPPISTTTTPTPSPTVTPTITSSSTPTPSVTTTGTETPTPTVTQTSTSTPTPTVTQTSTNTPTNTETSTPTPTVTPTQTVTPTSPLQVFLVTSGTTQNEACETGTSVTIYAFDPIFDQNTQFFDDASGIVLTDMSGFYSDGTSVTELDSDGSQLGSFLSCGSVPTPTPTVTQTSTSTPTPTVTQTPTNTVTPTNTETQTPTPTVTPTNTETQTPTPTVTQTNTPTVTQTPTQTFAWYIYSLGSGATSNDACTAFGSSPQTIYGSVAGGIGPNVGEILYETAGIPLTDVVPDGYYSNGIAWFEVTGGAGQITSSDPNGC